MRSSPRGPVLLAALALATTAAARGTDVRGLLEAVAAHARFAQPAIATGTLVRRGDAGETRVPIRIAGRRSTLRVDAGSDRALVRHGKALVRHGDAPARLEEDATIAGSNVRFGDLAAPTPRLLATPQIVDEGPAGTVVAAAPAGTSPYVLLVLTIDPARRVTTQVKYYAYAINNLVKRDARTDFVDVAGAPRFTHFTMWDVQGDTTTEISLVWQAAPALGRAPFTRAGLDVPLAP